MRTPFLWILSSALVLTAFSCSSRSNEMAREAPDHRVVGQRGDGTTMLPVHQLLTPHGIHVDLAGLRPQALALSPDARHVYVSGKTAELLVLRTEDGEVLQRVPLPTDSRRQPRELPPPVDKRAQLSYTGLVVSPDGRWIFLSNVRGSIKVFAIDKAGRVAPSHSLPLPRANAPRRKAEIPTGLALNSAGDKLYVCGNLSNKLLELDATSGELLREFDVGVAPFDVLLAQGRAFVSNQGGRRPGPDDLVGPAGKGTVVRVDPVRDIASEGSVSVIELGSGELVTETLCGLHSSALALSPDGRHVFCCNAGSDTISVLDARTGAKLSTLWCRYRPSDLLSATPNALAFSPTGERLYVCNGTQNAVAVFERESNEAGDYEMIGLVPVGWYPGAITIHDERVLVANIKGLGRGRAREDGLPNEFNTHQYHGSFSIFTAPKNEELAQLSAQCDANLRQPAIERALLPPRSGQPARALPERIGEASLIQHVVYVIKENRTYDQVLGDMPEGDGDPSLCIFGEEITPNQHALARQFVLLDNTYCAGILSADGHNWSTAAFANNYLERSFAGWPRSYPDGMEENDKDALAYSPAGFVWDHVLAAGLTLQNFGEFCQPRVRWRDSTKSGEPDFMACYRTWKGESDEVIFASEPVLRSLVPHSVPRYVGWNMSVPDQYRADVFLEELAQWEKRGQFPRLSIICLPQDHTSGTKRGCPTPAACVADGDLALGRIIEGISKSSFWPKTLVIAIEDDPQAGWDHVSGYRTTAFLAGPHVRRGARISTRYSTTSVIRTIEQILGIRPMNIFSRPLKKSRGLRAASSTPHRHRESSTNR
jgi:DNA-binding beta-propeller fold protein YncE